MDLKLSGYSKERALLDNAETMRSFLSGMAREIGMTIINGPTIVSFKEFSQDPEAGLSGMVIIAESHIAFHTWPEKSFAYVSIESCRPFDSSLARAFFKGRLMVDEILDTRQDMRDWMPA